MTINGLDVIIYCFWMLAVVAGHLEMRIVDVKHDAQGLDVAWDEERRLARLLHGLAGPASLQDPRESRQRAISTSYTYTKRSTKTSDHLLYCIQGPRQ